ncbi:GOLPH3/VPS74 family protein [Sanguibacter antarcticus]|uniref:Golgi phosphoprotein 3 GPP34 n=1 Tax=Sanguibacter antarcticus TaxID=372484 RepID=A0A2A9E4U5_9MICO|nr:GPP34 family phosphoprotein [Sanguibacter antarcticus]PFG34067.1 Golgi phosphoprotein 3 GPP34 [Sanguibacter antarcticus]
MNLTAPPRSGPSRGSMILVEEVALLLVHEISGRAVVDPSRINLALAGAVLLDLVASGQVEVAGPGEQVKAGRLVVRDPRPTGEPLLDEALRRIGAVTPRTPENMLLELHKGLREEVLARLVARGLLRSEEKRILRIFRIRSWPSTGSAEEKTLRTALYDVLVIGRSATTHEAAIVSMLHAVDRVPTVLGAVGVNARELRRRAKVVGDGGVADQAVRRAIDAVNAAMMVVLTAATVPSPS